MVVLWVTTPPNTPTVRLAWAFRVIRGKLKRQTELNPDFIRERLQFGEHPRWLTGRPTRPSDYLKKNIALMSVEECQLTYLHWMLEKTMGSPHAFRYVREEIQKEKKGVVTDFEVLAKFLKESAPEGAMGQYLQHAELAVTFQKAGILILHGGLTPENIGRLPDGDVNAPPLQTVSVWVDRLNEWYKKELNQWINSPGTQSLQPADSALDDLALPLLNRPKSIIIANMLDTEGCFAPPAEDVCAWLCQNKIRLVLTGHTPLGDFPLMLRAAENNLLFLDNDTGYANAHFTDPDDTRGRALHVTEITSDTAGTEVLVRGCLSDGRDAVTRLNLTSKGIEGDPNIGRVLPDQSVVQCQTKDGYRLVKKSGFAVFEYKTVSPEALQIPDMSPRL